MRGLFQGVALVLLLNLAIGGQANAAVIIVEPHRFTWEFTLVRVGRDTGASDLFAGQYGSDELEETDLLSVLVSAKGQSVPVDSRISRGIAGGLNGFLLFRDWDTAFPTLEGTVTMEILEGSVDIERISISVETPGNRFVASVSPNVRLVPEAGIPLMSIFGASLLGLRRRRGCHRGFRLPTTDRGDAVTG